VTCWRCGSIKIARTRSSAFDRVVRLLTGKKRVTCTHCLWTARIEWNEDDDFVPKVPALRKVNLPGVPVHRDLGVGRGAAKR
jgi:hypothetical protein